MTKSAKTDKQRRNQFDGKNRAADLTSGAIPNEQLIALLGKLESRISRIESHLGIQLDEREESSPPLTPEQGEDSEDALETQVGENWFAKVGIVVLALGVVFLLTFPYQNLPSYAPSAIGYVLVAVILALSRYWKESFQQVSRYMLGGGLLLLYFTTLRLSHFSPEPAITSTSAEMFLLVLVVVVNLAISIRKHSPHLTSLNLTLGFLTALAGGGPFFVLAVITATSLAAAYVGVRYQWNWILMLGIVLSYLTHLLWSMNNPVFGNPVQIILSSQISLLFIILYAGLFGTGLLMQTTSRKEDAMFITNSFLNGFGSYILITLLAFTAFRSSFAVWSLVVSGSYLALAVAFWIRSKSRYATFMYAMLGYAALSAAIADLSATPDVFVWLCWQSILVLSTAVWFRSRFIVVANFIIYLIIFIAYLSLAGTIGTISISFGIVALLSARILNWRKDRLELKTELMRNAYLASALFVLPYALYHVLPHGYVSTSWLGLALFYYIASKLLNNNRKYRWMALLTTLLTVGYVFVFELVGLDPAVRIISFLILGTALLAVSMIYSRKRRKTSS